MMLATVQVKPRADYESFIADRAANPSSIALGKEEWDHVCAVCHKLDESYIGPALGGNPLLTHPARLAVLLRNGFGRMPAVGSDWTDDQITALVAYYKELVKTSG
jgi:mono/diheme cytochrome c family protein